jgi:hypothetical protein
MEKPAHSLRQIGRFLLGVLLVHGIVILFHCVMMTNGEVGKTFQDIYYQKDGRKEMWILFDYSGPFVLMTVVAFLFLARGPFLFHLLGWCIAAATIIATAPLYSTRLVPQPLTIWGGLHPPPFAPLPKGNFPIMIMVVMTAFTLITRMSAREEQKSKA